MWVAFGLSHQFAPLSLFSLCDVMKVISSNFVTAQNPKVFYSLQSSKAKKFENWALVFGKTLNPQNTAHGYISHQCVKVWSK